MKLCGGVYSQVDQRVVCLYYVSVVVLDIVYSGQNVPFWYLLKLLSIMSGRGFRDKCNDILKG